MHVGDSTVTSQGRGHREGVTARLPVAPPGAPEGVCIHSAGPAVPGQLPHASGEASRVGDARARGVIVPVLSQQLDAASAMPLDVFGLYFGFSPLFRANKMLKVR